jgi:hypothetical protein
VIAETALRVYNWRVLEWLISQRFYVPEPHLLRVPAAEFVLEQVRRVRGKMLERHLPAAVGVLVLSFLHGWSDDADRDAWALCHQTRPAWKSVKRRKKQ